MICSITCGFCKFCRTERQHLCQTKEDHGLSHQVGRRTGLSPSLQRWTVEPNIAGCQRGNLVRLAADADINEMCKVSQINVDYRALKRARLHSGEIVLVNGASGIYRHRYRAFRLSHGRATDHRGRAKSGAPRARAAPSIPGELQLSRWRAARSITDKVKELTNGQGASVLAELAPGGIETTIECIQKSGAWRPRRTDRAQPEPLNLPLRYLMIRSIEFTSVTGRFAMDVAELLQLVQRGVIDTRHITTRYFPLTAVQRSARLHRKARRRRPALADVRRGLIPETLWRTLFKMVPMSSPPIQRSSRASSRS